VRGSVRDGILYVTVRDDGDGGADPQGQGILGRAAALGGRLDIESPDGAGPLLTAMAPVAPDGR
jgi:signal transduction histidine kinase